MRAPRRPRPTGLRLVGSGAGRSSVGKTSRRESGFLAVFAHVVRIQTRAQNACLQHARKKVVRVLHPAISHTRETLTTFLRRARSGRGGRVFDGFLHHLLLRTF